MCLLHNGKPITSLTRGADKYGYVSRSRALIVRLQKNDELRVAIPSVIHRIELRLSRDSDYLINLSSLGLNE